MHPSNNPLEQLTGRQRGILQRIAEGETTKSITLTLKMSPRTVACQRAKLMERLNIFDVAALVRFAAKIRPIQL